ncbi:unnamed protein product [Owenia fusiformis]|uniref:ATP-dependent RNA helicase DDX54 n=1 Tax=Owenia fusiformis TaxID=6347 RepID=A0A8J1UE23_OWEFU|nr:unnamed protein product [Owenia fusiformis]
MGKTKGPNKKRGQKTKKSPKFNKNKKVNQGFSQSTSTGANHGSQEKDSHDNAADSDEEFANDTRKMVAQQNRKKKKSGGFQAMGLSHAVFKGITRTGYKIPTPIQRKTIPLILEGKDVVAMARTGSGKTAAFLLPMFEKLKQHSAKSGARAIIMSPTRELALQTLKFTKELGRFSGLRAAVILGGDRMEDQFTALHENPDIIIATPGRFMHVVVEMDLKLHEVEYIVFDEADRLFEMGFQEQLKEIIARLPESRQTLLFSATLPKLMVEFARAGLHNPTLIRLDVDTKLSEQLKMSFLQCRNDDKASALLYLLKNVLKPKQQTVVFVATKHHVEYLQALLEASDIKCSYTYSSLDQTARKINVAKFTNKKTSVMLVTDLAARGIDIPMLDCVINYNFPAKPKLFVHRVGRVARAGQSGIAYSLVSIDELAYVIDLHLFLGRPMKVTTPAKPLKDEDGVYGMMPQVTLDEHQEKITQITSTSVDLKNLKQVSENGYKQYLRSRPAAASESIKRTKEMQALALGQHPMFGSNVLEDARSDLLHKMKSYKPNTTIFEINSTTKSTALSVMQTKRRKHTNVIGRNALKVSDREAKFLEAVPDGTTCTSSVLDDADIEGAFSNIVAPKRYNNDGDSSTQPPHKKKKQQLGKDEEYYISYKPKDYQSEKGLTVGASFEQQAMGAVLDFTGDDDKTNRKISGQKKWDRKKKKFVSVDSGNPKGKRKVKTESGQWINASYKTDIYKDWLNKNKVEEQEEDSDTETQKHVNPNRLSVVGFKKRGFHTKGSKKPGEGSGPAKGGFRNARSELKSKDQILKSRREHAKKENFQKHRQLINQKRRGKNMAGKAGKKGKKGRK